MDWGYITSLFPVQNLGPISSSAAIDPEDGDVTIHGNAVTASTSDLAKSRKPRLTYFIGPDELEDKNGLRAKNTFVWDMAP